MTEPETLIKAGPWMMIATVTPTDSTPQRCAYWAWRVEGWYVKKVQTGPTGRSIETLSGPYPCGPDAYWYAQAWAARQIVD